MPLLLRCNEDDEVVYHNGEEHDDENNEHMLSTDGPGLAVSVSLGAESNPHGPTFPKAPTSLAASVSLEAESDPLGPSFLELLTNRTTGSASPRRRSISTSQKRYG